MSSKKQRLKLFFSSVIGGSWGSEVGLEQIDLKCVRGTDFDSEKLAVNISSAPVRSYSKSDLRRRAASEGDLIIEKSGGGDQQPVGRAVLWQGPHQVMPTNFAARLRVTRETDPRFAAYLLASLWSDGRMRAAIKQTTGIQNLDLAALLSHRVSSPSLNSQRRVAAYLDRETAQIDRLAKARHRMVGLLEERDRAELSGLIVPPAAPFGQLRRFAKVQGGVTIDAKRPPGLDAVIRPYLRVANVQAGGLDLSEVTEIEIPAELARRSTLRKNDVLMTEGGDIDKLGRGTVWSGELDGCLHQNHVFAVRPDPERLDSWYLAFLTQSNHARAYFESTGVQSTNLASISSSKILGLPVPVLSLPAQREIVERWKRRAERSQQMRIALERQLALLKERRQALITAAVSGELQIGETS